MNSEQSIRVLFRVGVAFNYKSDLKATLLIRISSGEMKQTLQ